jgi:predicted nuclease with TOPRIM domain
MVSNGLILCAIIGFITWYYYQKFQESERAYYNLHSQFVEVCNENGRLKEKLSDLEVYKDDVSKTFKILDNELSLINNHIKTRAPPIVETPTNRVSLLTPEMLSNLFSNVNQENPEILASFSYEVHANPQNGEVHANPQSCEVQDSQQSCELQVEPESENSNYEKFLLNKNE